MRLLFDQNLSPTLVQRLSDLYSDASHVSLVGLDRASDEAVWSYALTNDYIIVTKDADFSEASVVRGFPPRVVWLRLGNCGTVQIEEALRQAHEAVVRFVADADLGVLEIV